MQIGWAGAAANNQEPYWLPTAKLDSSLNVEPYAPGPHGAWISPNGVNVFVFNTSDDRIKSWSCSTPWDLNTASSVASGNWSTPNGRMLAFNPDGTRYFYLELATGVRTLHQVNLSIAWAINSAVSSSSLNIVPQVSTTTVDDFGFNAAGTKLYVSDNVDSNSMWVWDLSGTHNLSTAVYNAGLSGGSNATFNSGYGVNWSDDGLMTFRANGFGRDLIAFDYATAFTQASQIGPSGTNTYDGSGDGYDSYIGMQVHNNGKFGLVSATIGTTNYLVGYKIA